MIRRELIFFITYLNFSLFAGFNQINFEIFIIDAKSNEKKAKLEDVQLFVYGNDSEKNTKEIKPKRETPIFGKKGFILKERDVKNIYEEHSDSVYFLFKYSDDSSQLEDIKITFAKSWFIDDDLYNKKNRNYFTKINNCNLKKRTIKNKTGIKLSFNIRNTVINCRVVDVNNVPLEGAYIKIIELDGNMSSFVTSDEKTDNQGHAKFQANFNSRKNNDIVKARVFYASKGFLPAWSNLDIIVGSKNSNFKTFKLYKRIKSTNSYSYCSKKGMKYNEECDVCECDLNERYYPEINKCDVLCNSNDEYPDIDKESRKVNCIKISKKTNVQLMDYEDNKRLTLEIDFGSKELTEMDVYLLYDSLTPDEFLNQIENYDDDKIGTVKLIEKYKGATKTGILEVEEELRFSSEEIRFWIEDDTIDSIYNKITNYKDVQKKGRKEKYFYNFDSSIFNEYLIELYFTNKENDLVYIYQLKSYNEVGNYLIDFRNLQDLHLQFKIDSSNNIILSNEDDYKRIVIEKSNLIFNEVDLDEEVKCNDCCDLKEKLEESISDCSKYDAYKISKAMYFNCSDFVKTDADAMFMITYSLYKYIIDFTDNQLIDLIENPEPYFDKKNNITFEPDDLSIVLLFLDRTLQIVKDTDTNFTLCDRAELHFLKAEIFYLLSQLLKVKEIELFNDNSIIQPIDFNYNQMPELLYVTEISMDELPFLKIITISNNKLKQNIFVHRNNVSFEIDKPVDYVIPSYKKNTDIEIINLHTAPKMATELYEQYKILSGQASIEGCVKRSTNEQQQDLKRNYHSF